VRLDLFLKASRLVKRRTIAQEMCEAGKVLVNGHASKPAKEVRPGNCITLQFSAKRIEVEVRAIPASSKKIDAALLYRVIAETRVRSDANT
jgi:ribosomal 50S subunit-recycling heat shock protein